MKLHYIFFACCLSFQATTAQYEFEQVADINIGSNSSSPRHFMEYNGELYFNASVSFQQRLYKTSGFGATLVSDLNGNSAGYNPKPLTVLNNKLLFHGSSQAEGMELFVTDGTASGTEILLDIFPGPTGSSVSDNIEFYAELNGELYFWARDVSGPFSLWKTDGTASGTVKILEPTFTAGLNYMKAYNGKIYFSAGSSPGANYELYVTDGTAAGTGLFLEINPSTANTLNAGSNPRDFYIFDGFLFFSADDGIHGRELWRTNGTAAGTTMVADIFPNNLNPAFGKDSSPSFFIEFNNELFFAARGYDTGLNQITGQELYKYTNTNGWNKVMDFYPGHLNSGLSAGSNPFFILNNELYVSAQDGTVGLNLFEIWKTDGTESGTLKMIDTQTLNNVSPNFSLLDKSFVILNNKLFFEHNLQQVWVTDGTNAGTQQLTNMGIVDVPTGVTVFQPIVFNNEIYFDGNYPSQGVELWKISDTTLSASNVLESTEISIYPNPTNSLLNIQHLPNSQKMTLKVFDLLGKELLSTANQDTIDVSYLNSGTYILRIQTDTKIYNKKFIKK
ncbi:Por secretion system C-terminal sorting domain-containing protein [Bizionia echini]|uniref:Por secretion system C-terminal sorting domain-containing protein n=1 Tax=Bizionia echini TaxID=649333 RepID=A0A1I5AP69_9FLAO|nr:T9SS type A sorting domain-containing protein [Bizionia echini]SFN64274.1 Por secretion system C-terminal sorting domain-containing protein [Bizionia echini]